MQPTKQAAAQAIPDLSTLTGHELIATIEACQRLLDGDLTLSPTKLKCPKCGHTGYFRIEAYQWIDWEPREITANPNHDPEWGAESACNCPECNHPGRVLDFIGNLTT